MAEQKNDFNISSLLKNWKVLLALAAVFILVFELFAMGLLGSGSILGKQEGKQMLGNAEFNGSIRTYEPFLFIPSNYSLSGNVVNEIKALPGVTQLNSESSGTVIRLETRDDVYPVALALKKKGITTYSLANIAAPSQVAVVLENGQVINASASSVAIRVETQPIIPVDSIVTVTMVVLVENNQVVQYGSALIKREEKTVSFEGEVQKEKIKQVFYVPWQERNNVDAASLGNASFKYEKNNLGTFSEELPLETVMSAKGLDYVVYIDKKSAVFAENFTDAERAAADLGVSIDFQPSLLIVESDEKLQLPYNGTQSYLYEISLSSPDYILPEEMRSVSIETEERLAGRQANVSASVIAVGPVVLGMENETILR